MAMTETETLLVPIVKEITSEFMTTFSVRTRNNDAMRCEVFERMKNIVTEGDIYYTAHVLPCIRLYMLRKISSRSVCTSIAHTWSLFL